MCNGTSHKRFRPTSDSHGVEGQNLMGGFFIPAIIAMTFGMMLFLVIRICLIYCCQKRRYRTATVGWRVGQRTLECNMTLGDSGSRAGIVIPVQQGTIRQAQGNGNSQTTPSSSGATPAQTSPGKTTEGSGPTLSNGKTETTAPPTQATPKAKIELLQCTKTEPLAQASAPADRGITISTVSPTGSMPQGSLYPQHLLAACAPTPPTVMQGTVPDQWLYNNGNCFFYGQRNYPAPIRANTPPQVSRQGYPATIMVPVLQSFSSPIPSQPLATPVRPPPPIPPHMPMTQTSMMNPEQGAPKNNPVPYPNGSN